MREIDRDVPLPFGSIHFLLSKKETRLNWMEFSEFLMKDTRRNDKELSA